MRLSRNGSNPEARCGAENIADLRSWVGVHSNQAGQVWELTWECVFGRRGFGEQRIQLGGTLFAGRHSGFARPASPWSSLTTQPRHESAPRLEGTFDGGTVCRTVQRLHSGGIEYPHRHPPTRQLYRGLAETTDAQQVRNFQVRWRTRTVDIMLGFHRISQPGMRRGSRIGHADHHESKPKHHDQPRRRYFLSSRVRSCGCANRAK